MPLRELSTMFSYRFLFGPTVVPYFPRNKGFIYLLHFYVSVYSGLSHVCCSFALVSLIGFCSVFLAYLFIFQISSNPVFGTLIRTLC